MSMGCEGESNGGGGGERTDHYRGVGEKGEVHYFMREYRGLAGS